jgi:glycosidase
VIQFIFDGVRLDAVKHIAPQFYNEMLDYMRSEVNPDLFACGRILGTWLSSSVAKIYQRYRGKNEFIRRITTS